MKLQSLGENFFESAIKYGDRICQIDSELNEGETFKSVNERSVRVALQLQSRGITNEDAIVFCTKNTLDSAIPVLASLYLGAKIASLDPTLSIVQTKHLLSVVEPRIIFVEETSVQLIEQSLGDLRSEIIVYGNSMRYSTLKDLSEHNENEKEFKPSKVDVDDVAVMFFSSGTTGLPKAICHSHRTFYNIIESMMSMDFDLSSLLAFTTFYWITGVMFFTAAFWHGGYRVINRITEAENFFKCIEKYKVTLLFLSPILTYQLTDLENWQNYDTSSLNAFLTGGTRTNPTLLQKASTIFRNAKVLVCYGLTEVGFVSSFTMRDNKAFVEKKITSCGRIVPEATLKIVNIENNKVCGVNERGEVRLKTNRMMIGYYKMDSSDACDEEGFLKTGDIGYYDEDDCVYVVERIKEMFKYLSWHIVPSLLEVVITEHPAVREALVYGVHVNEEVGDMPAALVVLKRGSKCDEKEIEDFVAQRVADREKLRGGVKFVEGLPRTATGKLKRTHISHLLGH